jgi:hypothetical protein
MKSVAYRDSLSKESLQLRLSVVVWLETLLVVAWLADATGL